jgi:tetratricopeptide (TPR) repeat protein
VEPTPPPPAATTEPPNQVVDAQESAKKVIEHLYEHYQSQDHWAVLGVKRGSSREEIDSAFREKSRLYHPDNYHHIQDGGFQEKLSHVFCRLDEAHQTLTGQAEARGYEELTKKERQYEKKNKEWSAPPKEVSPEKKSIKEDESTPAPVRDAKDGKAFFAQAKNAFLKCDYWMTIQFCQQAIEIIGDQPEYYHLLGMAQKENPKWRKDAERNLKIAIKLDSWKPEYLVALGKLYQDAGMSVRAEKMFEQVRALDPSFPIPD